METLDPSLRTDDGPGLPLPSLQRCKASAPPPRPQPIHPLRAAVPHPPPRFDLPCVRRSCVCAAQADVEAPLTAPSSAPPPGSAAPAEVLDTFNMATDGSVDDWAQLAIISMHSFAAKAGIW